MNDRLRAGVIKSLVIANALREHDKDVEHYEDALPRPPIARTLVWAARTGIVLQLMCVFEEGLEDYVDTHFPEAKPDRLKNRIAFLKVRGLLKRSDRCERLNTLRNELAHEPDRHATWEEWHETFRTVGTELEHLGVISRLTATPEEIRAQEEEERLWAEGDEDEDATGE